jgi:hypothetical protein
MRGTNLSPVITTGSPSFRTVRHDSPAAHRVSYTSCLIMGGHPPPPHQSRAIGRRSDTASRICRRSGWSPLPQHATPDNAIGVRPPYSHQTARFCRASPWTNRRRLSPKQEHGTLCFKRCMPRLRPPSMPSRRRALRCPSPSVSTNPAANHTPPQPRICQRPVQHLSQKHSEGARRLAVHRCG